MKLISEKYSEKMSMVKTKKPRIGSFKSRYYWDYVEGIINGITTKFFLEVGYGSWLYFQFENHWRKVHIYETKSLILKEYESLDRMVGKFELVEFGVGK